MAQNKHDHWKDIGTSKPEQEPAGHAQDKSRKSPAKERQEQYQDAGEAGRQTGETFKQ